MSDDAVPEESGWRVARREEAADHREPPVAAEITIRLYSLEPGDAQVTIGLGDAISLEGEATALVWDEVGRRAAAELAEAVRLLRP